MAADLTMYRGDDVTIDITIAGTGSIAGWEFEFLLWRNKTDVDFDDGDAVLVLRSSDANIAITDAVARIVRATIASANTDDLDPRTYAFRFRRTSPRKTLRDGTIEIKR